MKVAFSLLTCTNERNTCRVKTRCFKLDWLFGIGLCRGMKISWHLSNITVTIFRVKGSGKQANSSSHTLQEMRQSLELDQYKAFPSLLNSCIPISFAQELNMSYEEHARTHTHRTHTHTDPLMTRETTFTSPHFIPLLVSARFQNAFNHLFTQFPHLLQILYSCACQNPAPASPPKNQLHCLFTTTGNIPLWVRIAVMCPEQSECPSHTSLTARPITGLWWP